MPSPTVTAIFRVLHLEDSELDHELLVAHLRRGGLNAHTAASIPKPRSSRRSTSPGTCVVSDYNLPGFSGLVALELLKASSATIPFILVSGEIGEDTAVEAMRNGASDYLQKNHLARLVPALLHAVDAAETRRARVKADRDLVASKQRLHELAQHLQTSVEHERAAIAREIHDDVGGSLTALKFDLAWIARHSSRRRCSRVQSALETVTTRSSRASGSCTTCARPSSSRAWRRRCTGCALALRAPHGVVCTSACRRAARAAAGRAAGRLPHRAGGADQHQQARARDRGADRPSLAGGVLSLEISDNGRGLSQDDLARRARSASAACTSAPTRSAAGSTSRAAARHDADPVGAARRAATAPTSPSGRPTSCAYDPSHGPTS
jgi:FixJ family two-component response regulator